MFSQELPFIVCFKGRCTFKVKGEHYITVMDLMTLMNEEGEF